MEMAVDDAGPGVRVFAAVAVMSAAVGGLGVATMQPAHKRSH